jgi:hypothetical protein
VIKTFKYTCHVESFLWGLKICTNVKNQYEKKNLIIIFLRKKSLDLNYFENHVVTFPYWFWFGNNYLNNYLGS